MPVSLINGATQLRDASVTAAKLAGSIPDSALSNGANYVKRDGSVAFTADHNFGGFKGTNAADPTAAQDVVNLRTLQTFAAGFGVTKRARMLANSNIALTGTQTIDGVVGVAGDLVWLNAQTTGSQNGLWTMNAGAWTRPATWAAASSQKSSMLFIEQGTTFADTKWTVAADNITVDTTTVTAVQDTSGGTYTAGNGLSLTGNVFAVKLLSTGGISFDGSQNLQIALNGASLNVGASGLKVSDSTSNGQVMIGNASNAATFTTLSGDIASITGAGVVTLATTFAKKTDFINNETPTGTVNGVNAAFTLANTPAAGTLMLFLNGQLLEAGAGNDYTLTTNAVTMLQIPQTGDKLRATYFR
jgi:hypothetical protein